MSKFTHRYFTILAVIDLLLFCFCAAGALGFYFTMREMFLQMAVIALFFGVLAAVNIAELVKYMRGGTKLIRKSLIMKSSVFLIAFGIFYATLKVLPAFLILTALGIFVGLILLAYAHDEKNTISVGGISRSFEVTAPVPTGRFEGYKAQQYYNDAAEEFNVRFTQEEQDKMDDRDLNIYRYASMPIIYFLKWIIDNGYASNELKAKYGNQKWDILEMFGNVMDYTLARDDIDARIIDFADHYLGEQTSYSLETPNLMFDYYEAVKNEGNFFYCVDYSKETAKKLAEAIRKRYLEFSFYKRYDELKTDRKIRWNGHGDLDVIIVCGTTNEIIRKCEVELNSIQPSQFKKAGRMIGDSNFPDGFKPESIVLYGLIDFSSSFHVIGSAGAGEERKISFSVTDCHITDVGDGTDYEEPWSPAAIEKQIKAREDVDLYCVNDQAKIDELKKNGELVYIENEDWYVTPHAAELKERCDTCIKALEHKVGMLRTEWNFAPCNGSLIPKVIYVRAYRDKMLKFAQSIEIWD